MLKNQGKIIKILLIYNIVDSWYIEGKMGLFNKPPKAIFVLETNQDSPVVTIAS